MLRDEVTVEVRDRNLERKGTITTKSLSLKATIRHLGVGEWELTLPRDHPMVEHLLTAGSGIIVSLRGQERFSGLTTKPRRETNQQNPDGTYTFKGVTDDVLLLDALAFPSPDVADPGSQTASNDTQTDNAETLMRHYVSANICLGIAPTARTAGFRQYLRVETTNQNRGVTLTKAPRFQNLMELLSEIAIGADLGFQVIQRGSDLVFEVLTLTDRSDLVRLDIKNGTITSESSEVSAPSITRAIVAGQGEGIGRTIIERTSTSSTQSETDWGRVIEQFVDQRNASELVELEQSGDERLIAGQLATTAIKIVPSDDQTMVYGTDWEVGDTIAVVIDGSEAKTTVTAMTMIINDQVSAIGAAIGDVTEFDADAALVKRLENVETRTANLERSEGGSTAETHVINGLNKGSLYGSTIPAGTVVMFGGSHGDVIDIIPAVADGTYPEHYLVGITAHDIGVDQFGSVVQLGVVDQIDTSMWTLGSILYADATVPGGLSTTQGAWGTAIAAVTRVHTETGRILVRAIPGGSGGGASVYEGDTAPTSGNYAFWFKTDDGTFFYRYDDGDSTQWVETKNPNNYTGDTAIQAFSSRMTAVEGVTTTHTSQISTLTSQVNNVRAGFYVRQVFSDIDTTERTFGTGWQLMYSAPNHTGWKSGSKVKIHIELPLRNDSTSWGGAYVEPQITFNGGSNWYSLGSSGYDGNVMYNQAQSIATYTRMLYVDPQLHGISGDFSVAVRIYCKTYDGTGYWNGNHNLNATSGTASAIVGSQNWNQHYARIHIEELATGQ